ncbi:unnamed protein product [Lactuca virosa]|uniref:Myb-like domain-containing protein n=1 Tax=Lactuca virosa TaxID=75947 RepID=A0AAU9PA58_9ASTR|nr:unnamed protein product [Lactuca virosa]
MSSNNLNSTNQNASNPFALFGYDPTSTPRYRSQMDPSILSQNQVFVGGVLFTISNPTTISIPIPTTPNNIPNPNANAIPISIPTAFHTRNRNFFRCQARRESSTKKGNSDPGRWSKKEEIELTKTWVDIYEDNKTGKGQSCDQFWLHVMDRFCKGMGRDLDYRISDQCNLKWNIVNKLVTHWNRIYKNFENQ